jgi:Flp pilus assembly protein TadD
MAWLVARLSLPIEISAQQAQVLGSIIGRATVVRSGAPPQRVLVSLMFRGAAIESAYTDSQGTFGFHNLEPNPYTVRIDDDPYVPVEQSAIIEANNLAPMIFLNINLVPKPADRDAAAQKQPRVSGSNPDIADVREFSANFPKSVLKEFHKGVAADQDGKKEDAIRHYAKAVQIEPNFYPAHNNLGSDYVSKSDFAGARKEFEQVVRLNQSDAAAYFNLSNVCMLTGQLADAQRYLGEGMRRQPDSALGHFLLGSLDIKTGKLQQAETVLRQAIQLSPTMAEARLRLVNLMLQEGRKSDAVNELQEFVKTFPESSFIPRARELLHSLQAPQPASATSN